MQENVAGPFLNEYDDPWTIYHRITLEREILSAMSVVALNFVERGDQRVDIKSALCAAETLPDTGGDGCFHDSITVDFSTITC